MAVWSTGSILRRLPQRSKDFRAAKSQARTRRHAKRPPRERLRCVLGMLSSLEVKVLRPT